MEPPCLTDEEIALLVDQQADPALAERAAAHLPDCTPCRQLFAHARAARSGGASASSGSGAGSSDPGTSLPDADPTWRPPPQVNEFRIDEPLGQGTFGAVYRAFDTRLQRAVAIKFLQRCENDATREQLLKEARVLALFPFHPNIVILLTVGEIDQRLYLVSELVTGRTLDKLGGPQPAARVLRCGIDIAAGLVEAHHRGVCHRDLKPKNLILTESGVVKILDFGLAKLGPEGRSLSDDLAVPLAATQRMIGTPLYMSPEQWRMEPITARSDLYALGAVLYELCAGHPPLSGPDLASLKTLVLGGDALIPLAEAAPAVPRRLARIIEQCLERDPARRPASAADVLRELQRIERQQRLRPRLIVALVLAVGVAAFVGSLWRPERRPPGHRDETPRLVPHPGGVLHRGTDEAALEGLLPLLQRELQPPDPLGFLRERTKNERPAGRVQVAPFAIYNREVTYREFAAFLNERRDALRVQARRAGGSAEADPFLSVQEGPPLIDMEPSPRFGLRLTADGVKVWPEYADHPVTQVTWWGAQAYCAAHGAALPTEEQYELLVRGAGPRPRRFAWGDDDDNSCAGVTWGQRPEADERRRCKDESTLAGPRLPLADWQREGSAQRAALACPAEQQTPGQRSGHQQRCEGVGTRAVQRSPLDVTTEGVYDLTGNVAEWTRCAYRVYQAERGAPLSAPDRCEEPKTNDEWRVARGGHAEAIALNARGASRQPFHADDGPSYVGFRCAVPAREGASPP